LRINHTTFDADGPGPAPPTVISILPNEDLRSESVIAYELGYRLQPRKNLYLDLATFYNVYDDLVVDESTGAGFEISPLPPHLAITSRTANKMHGETYGVEFAPSWNVTDWWKLSAGYTWLQMNLHSEAPGRSGEEQEGDSPKQQFHIRSFLHLPHNFTFDTAAYYVDTLPNQAVSSYVRLDVRLGWRPTKDLELSFGAVNLLDDRHPEFRSFAFRPLEAQRSFYGKLTWRF
jgi:iron complex outermembrane receptor protein